MPTPHFLFVEANPYTGAHRIAIRCSLPADAMVQVMRMLMPKHPVLMLKIHDDTPADGPPAPPKPNLRGV